MTTTRTYRAPNLKAALAQVQRDLGPDAVVVSVRKVLPGPFWQVWRTPEIEVMAMPAGEASRDTPKETVAEMEERAQSWQNLFNQLRSRAHAAAKLPAGTPAAPGPYEALPPPAAPPASLEKIHLRLVAQGLEEDLVSTLLKTCQETFSPQTLEDELQLHEVLIPQLQACIRSSHGSAPFTGRVVCLIGMRGSGKTTTCAKLAAHFLHEPGRKIVWVCADTVSAGAISEARMFTEALCIPLRVVYTPEELAATVSQEADADLILIDTPGCNPYKETNVVELADFLTVLPERAIYLVAPATAKESDLNRFFSIFKPFGLKGLLVTRLDETNTYGNIFNLARHSQLQFSFFSTGPRVPDDLQPAECKSLVSAMLGKGWMR